MSLSIGIVGLPNVGKSSLFTALTKKSGFAANYPFATIEPNVGLVPVPDKRLDGLAAIDHPAKIIPATVEFVDIAGLVAGASQGEGLGNKFLANIRETDAICEVVRFFSDPNVEHVSKKVDPQSDVETIKTELILADIATIEKALPRLEKEGKRYKEKAINFEAAQKVLEGLNEGKRALQLNLSEEEQDAIRELCLLTMKPMLYIANVDEDKVNAELPEIDGQQPCPSARRLKPTWPSSMLKRLPFSWKSLAWTSRAFPALFVRRTSCWVFRAISPAVKPETRAWTIPVGAKAPQAAGVIHSDFERGFIKAETASYEDYVALGGEKGCRDAGKLRQEGKDYVVQDGDVMHFKFNV